MAKSKHAELLTSLGFDSEHSPVLQGVGDAASAILGGRELLLRKFCGCFMAVPAMQMTVVVDELGELWFKEAAVDMSSFGFRHFLNV